MTVDYKELLAAREAGTEIEAPLDLVLYPDPFLRRTANAITEINDEIRSFADDMIKTMYASQGVGLAAQQVGFDGQMLVMDPYQDGRNPAVVINPEIVAWDGYWKEEEGCLSIPGYRADVERASSLQVRFTTLDGSQILHEAEDFEAVVLQHEIDHLEGILFVDRISRLRRAEFLRKFGVEKRKFQRPGSLANPKLRS